MKYAHRLLYRTKKVAVTVIAFRQEIMILTMIVVSLGSSMAASCAQIPWQSLPATPAQVTTPPRTTQGTAAASQTSGKPATGPQSTATQPSGPQTTGPQTVVNRYATQGIPAAPMIPFNPAAQNYSAVNLPPPGAASPVGNPPATGVPDLNAAQSLINAVSTPPMQPPQPMLNTSTTFGGTPVLSDAPILGNLPVLNGAMPQSDLQARGNPGGLPGAGQLLPRNVPAQTGNQNMAGITTMQNQPGVNTQAPNLNSVPGGAVMAPDITRAGSEGKRLVSYSTSAGSPQQQSSDQVVTDIWNTKLVAIVGNERILAGDMAAIIEPIILENSGKFANKKQENEARQMLVRQVLPQYVQMKALQQEFFRDIAGNVTPKELQKKKDEIMSKASKAFYDKYVPIELYRRYKVEDLSELEGKLQDKSLSLQIMKNHFLMQVLAMQLEDKYVAESFEIPPGDILAYYEKNIDRWRISARAKWRELVVRFDKHPNRAEADNLIKQMGNEVVLTGKPFEAVARDSSEGITASSGGKHDWTNQGSLKSEIIDQALFSLPMRRLSQIIEDEVGYHIIEVIEREPARIQDMSEIQTEIRKILSDEIRKDKLDEFREKVMDRIPVWSKWPQDIPGSKPLDETLEESDR